MKKQRMWTKNPCIICGEEIKITEYMIQMTTGGEFVSPDYDGEDSQGSFPIGAGCAKKPEYRNLVVKVPESLRREVS